MDLINILDQNPETFDDSNLALIQDLCAQGLNPNRLDYGGISVFHLAVNNPSDNIKVVEELIRAGADVNLPTHLDFTPLHFAVAYRKRRVIKTLIQSGASVNAKDFLGRTSLHLACSILNAHDQFGNRFILDTAVIKELLKYEETDFNAKDSNGNTPLMVAIKSNELLIAVQLLQNNANPNICNNALETPLHSTFSIYLNYTEFLLLKRGANIYSLDKNGEIPLEILFKHGFFLRSNEWILSILKLIALHYNITSDLRKKFEIFSQLSYYKIPNGIKKKFELIPQLSHNFNKFCDEVDQMKSDFILDNITMHDFCLDCFADDFKYQVEQMKNDFIFDVVIMTGVSWNDFKEDHFNYHQNQIYGAVVERLVRDIYPEYFSPIFNLIPSNSLFSELISIADSRISKDKEKIKTLAHLFSLLDIINLFKKHLSRIDFFSLIVAFSDVKDVKSMRNLRARNAFNFFETKIKF